MSDLIDRHDAIKAIETSRFLIDAIEKVMMLPTAQPKTGKWINANDGKWNTVEVLKCSACGEMDNRMYRTDKYCPNCGAKMLKDGD